MGLNSSSHSGSIDNNNHHSHICITEGLYLKLVDARTLKFQSNLPNVANKFVVEVGSYHSNEHRLTCRGITDHITINCRRTGFMNELDGHGSINFEANQDEVITGVYSYCDNNKYRCKLTFFNKSQDLEFFTKLYTSLCIHAGTGAMYLPFA